LVRRLKSELLFVIADDATNNGIELANLVSLSVAELGDGCVIQKLFGQLVLVSAENFRFGLHLISAVTE
jgi:hypothetical protein